jgi:hypothetical protein
MSERLQVVATTIVVFLLGLAVGIWTQRMRPMPPPPIRVMGEFGPPAPGRFGPPPPPPWMMGFGQGPPPGPGEVRIRVAALQPQIDAFRHSVETIEEGFRKQLDALLTSEQRSKLHELEAPMPMPPPPLPGCAGEMGNLFVPMIIYRPTLDRMTALLRLDPQQHDQLRKLMVDRRNRLLALIDETPPPSFKLGQMLSEGVVVASPPSP